MQQVATRTGDPDLTMDPKAMPTTTKVGTRKAQNVIVLKQEMRIAAKTGTSGARSGIILGGEVRSGAKAGINKARLAIALAEGTTGAGLQDPSQLLKTPEPRATTAADGAMEAGQLATATIPT